MEPSESYPLFSRRSSGFALPFPFFFFAESFPFCLVLEEGRSDSSTAMTEEEEEEEEEEEAAADLPMEEGVAEEESHFLNEESGGGTYKPRRIFSISLASLACLLI